MKLEALLQSAAKATRHILGTALMSSSDMLLWRRDTALASSSLLPGPSREALRAAPLAASSLFGGLCEKTSKEDVAERQRVLLNRQTGPGASSSTKKYPKPRSRARGKSGRLQARSQAYKEVVPKQEPVFHPPQPPPAYSGRGRGADRARGRGFSFSSRRPRRGRR